MLTEQTIYNAQKHLSTASVIQTIDKDYSTLTYVSILANPNFENTNSQDLQTLFFISKDDTKGANWIIETVKWLLQSPFVMQSNQNGILAADLHQFNYSRIHDLWLNLDSLTDTNVNTEMYNFLCLIDYGYKKHFYLRIGN